jgi:type IV pilus assembly protein PilQ
MNCEQRVGFGVRHQAPVWILAAAAGMTYGVGPAMGQLGLDRLLGGEESTAIGDTGQVKGATGGAVGDEGMEEGEGINVSEYMTVDIFVQDEDLANVLQMLSLQSRQNIVASRDVAATVSANLYGVTFHEALDAILNVNGYSWYEQGNFIYVVTAAEAAEREEANRTKVAKVVQLNYLNSNDAAEFVTPLLSDVGEIKTNGDAGEYSLPEDSPAGGEDFALSSTLVIFDYPEHVEEIEALLHQIDTRPAQVLVEATILQTQLTEANAFGVDFAILSDIEFTDFFSFGGPLGSAAALGATGANEVSPTDGRASSVVSTAGNFAGPGTLKAGIIHDDLGVFIRALDEVSDVTILSNPKILALNRQPARVLVGRKLGYLNTTSTETATTQTVEFLDTGTQLSFRPFISNDGNIRMELKPRVSEGVIRAATDVTGAAVTIPDEITQELTTNVIVPDGATVVLGGLFKETTNLSRSQVPVLGDIPLIGLAFQGHDDSTDRSEIIFMIKPTIVNDTMLSEYGASAEEYSEHVRTGTRAGLLPFSRDRQSMQLNLKADEYARKGEYDRAQWQLRRSLELNPAQPTVIRMLEELEEKRDRWPTRSLLERVINGEVEKTYRELGHGGSPWQGEAIGAFDDFSTPDAGPFSSMTDSAERVETASALEELRGERSSSQAEASSGEGVEDEGVAFDYEAFSVPTGEGFARAGASEGTTTVELDTAWDQNLFESSQTIHFARSNGPTLYQAQCIARSSGGFDRTMKAEMARFDWSLSTFDEKGEHHMMLNPLAGVSDKD